MQFRDLGAQYQAMKGEIDRAISSVLDEGNFIGGWQVSELERVLCGYVGARHCIACANGTDALALALMAWGIGPGDAVFVPDFTFFASGEVVSLVGATPVFVDVEMDTYNISPQKLEEAIVRTEREGELRPRVAMAVDLFGQPANYPKIREVAGRHGLLVLEDGAQGLGGRIGERMACSFGDISTTSFFPAKPLGCYGDGGAVFTDNDEWAERIRSLHVHGKGKDKYDNVRVGMNSRLDTVQAAVLLAKFPHFRSRELEAVDNAARTYTELLRGHVATPTVREGFSSSWAQYTIRLEERRQRDALQAHLREHGVPSMVYYQKAMHRQVAFSDVKSEDREFPNTLALCETVLSLPMHPYLREVDIHDVTEVLKNHSSPCDLLR